MKKLIQCILPLFLFVFSISLTAQTINPANHAYGVSLTETLSYSNASTYDSIAVYGDAAMTDTIFYDVAPTGSGTSTVSLTFTNELDYGTKYYWDVHVQGAAWLGAMYEFTTLINAQPTLSHPADGGEVVTFTPSLHWYSTGLPTGGHYTIEISDDNTDEAGFVAGYIDTIYPDSVGGNTTQYTVPASPALVAGDTYYWRVRSWYGANFSEASDISSFVVSANLGPVAPTLIWPTDSTEVFTTEPWLSWQANSITIGIEYEVYSSTDGTTFTASGDTTTSTLYQLTGLSGNQAYWWCVVASDGSSSNASDTAAFYTSANLGVVAPTLYYPIDDETIYTDEPWMSWGSNSTATGLNYTVYIDDTTGYGGSAPDTTTLKTNGTAAATSTNTTLAQVTGFTFTGGGKYYWMVEVNDGSNWAFSAVDSFTVTEYLAGTPVQPVISYPSGGAILYSTSNWFYWYTSVDNTGLKFEIEIDTVDVALTGVADTTDISGTLHRIDNLDAGTYHWAVRSYVGSDYSDWSVTDTFSISASVDPDPPVPTLAYPTDNPSIYTLTPWLSWYIDQYISGLEYIVEVDLDGDDNFTGSVTDTTVTGQFVMFDPATPLEPGNTYYWRVSSQFVGDAASNSGHSGQTAGQFTIVNNVNIRPQTPQLSSPVSNAAVDPADFEFYWYVLGSTTDLEFYLEYKLDNATWGAATNTGWITATSYDPPSALSNGAIYRWRVKSRYKSTTESAWSTEGVFLTTTPAGPIQPMVGSPIGSVRLDTEAPTLSWFVLSAENAGVTYNVVVSTTPDMANTVVQQDNVDAKSLQIEGLEAEQTYYWQVQAKNSEGVSEFSEKGVFGTTSITSVEDETLPEKFAVDQNYPNPFNPSTNIKYALPENAFVTVKIYNILGQEVRTLVNKEMTAGRHQVIWNGRNDFGSELSTGIYIYSVTSGNQIISKKMLLLK